ncbi:MAG: serine hydrolase domain-containing protein [Pseudomonadota bacterium]
MTLAEASAAHAVLREESDLPWAVLYDSRAGAPQFFGPTALHDDMHIRLASVSKLVIGLVYARLVKSGTLRPEDTLGDDTLNDLATHATGLQDALHDPAFRAIVNADVTQPQPLDRVIEASLNLPRVTPPNYANINAILLARACERATERPFSDLLPDCDGLTFPADGRIPAPSPGGVRRGRADGRIEYGDTLFDASRYNPSWAGHSGTGTLRVGAIPAFCDIIVAAIARETPRQDSGYQNLARFENGWVCHAGDVPGASAWAGHHPSTNRTVFAATGLCWSKSLGNPAEAIAKASLK